MAWRFVGLHRVAELVDQGAVRFEDKGDAGFLPLQREVIFGEAIECIPRPRLRQKLIEVFRQRAQVGGQYSGCRGLAAIVAVPAGNAPAQIGERVREGVS
ncbi:MAG: hypothetical protein E5V53_32255, partial [Mesorhizobium sp.]